MASENAPNPAPPPREAVEQQDQSIKVRKSLIFEPTQHADGAVIKPFPEYLKTVPAAPLTPVVKAALWCVGVLIVLLFLAALFMGRSPAPRGRCAERSNRPRPVVAGACERGPGWLTGAARG
jgi:hypothetical protein